MWALQGVASLSVTVDENVRVAQYESTNGVRAAGRRLIFSSLDFIFPAYLKQGTDM